jgi:hypothetical protein
MNFRTISILLTCFGLATIAFAEAETKTKMAISIADDSGDVDVHFELDSDVQGFNLHDMQEGENRSIIDKSGRAILVTREADGYRFDVDGKSVNIPLIPGGPDGPTWVGDHGDKDIRVHVMHATGEMGSHEAVSMSMPAMISMSEMPTMEGVMIISDKSIDDATQQAIKALLGSAGHGNEVRFIGADQGHGMVHGVRVVEQTVEVTD